MALAVGAPTSSQDTTQNPQTVPTQTVGATVKSGGVQPGTATALLNSTSGVSLHSSALTVVNLSNTSAKTSASSVAAPAPAKHHINPAAISIPIVLCVIAVGLFWAVSRSAKSTTE